MAGSSMAAHGGAGQQTYIHTYRKTPRIRLCAYVKTIPVNKTLDHGKPLDTAMNLSIGLYLSIRPILGIGPYI